MNNLFWWRMFFSSTERSFSYFLSVKITPGIHNMTLSILVVPLTFKTSGIFFFVLIGRVFPFTILYPLVYKKIPRNIGAAWCREQEQIKTSVGVGFQWLHYDGYETTLPSVAFLFGFLAWREIKMSCFYTGKDTVWYLYFLIGGRNPWCGSLAYEGWFPWWSPAWNEGLQENNSFFQSLCISQMLI